jgi:gamma-glutamyltranspeptidase/glutathione hydrolase
MLRTVEDIDLTTLGLNSPSYVDLLARVMSRAFADGAGTLADPMFASVAVERLLSRNRARQFLSSGPRTSRGELRRVRESNHTTHVTAADSDGTSVAITHSIGSVTGSGAMTPDLGFFYNNFLGFFNPSPGHHDSLAPGKRVGGGCPTIAVRGGAPIFAIGSSGGSRLVSAVFQTILNVFVHGLTPQEAVTMPRFHCEQDGVLYVEPTFQQDTIDSLRSMGYEVAISPYMGCNQAIQFEDGSLNGASDPRGGIGIAMT